jgi:hypothetical protein
MHLIEVLPSDIYTLLTLLDSKLVTMDTLSVIFNCADTIRVQVGLILLKSVTIQRLLILFCSYNSLVNTIPHSSTFSLSVLYHLLTAVPSIFSEISKPPKYCLISSIFYRIPVVPALSVNNLTFYAHLYYLSDNIVISESRFIPSRNVFTWLFISIIYYNSNYKFLVYHQ